MKIGLTSVFVNDPLEAYKFYTKVLGFEKKTLYAGSQFGNSCFARAAGWNRFTS